MADHLTARASARGAVAWLALGAAVAAGAAGAAWSESAPMGDPMRPSYLRPARGTDGLVSSGPRLQAVFGNADSRVAIVSGRVLTLGGRVGALTITRINPQAIELRDGKRLLVLSLNGQKLSSGGDVP